tara:strand:- start:8 stop:241 length:234 start_codon:yes stop_codon:yes gene_type:complete
MVKYTEEEIAQMKQILSNIGRGIPKHLTSLWWKRYKEISGNSKEPQPCTCPKAANLWYKASTAIARYLDDLEGNEIV